MAPVVVVDDVAPDHLPGFVEGLELVAPDLPFLELAEPGLDERLALGVAVAATAMGDAEVAQPRERGPGGEGRAVVGAEGERAGLDAAGRGRLLDHLDGLDGAAAQAELE